MENFQNKLSPKSKMLSLAVVLISLSASTTATEPRKCYWCGPLAEQVHKSTRAPSCNEPSIHVTTCDPGYTHCAVVATSPPYTESRLCVKLYQDECYSLYCNSTKIWRMTCPCLGDLCNGPNTQREKEAFSILNKHANKSQNTRNKRTLISPPNLITNINNDIDNKSNEIEFKITTNKDNGTADTINAQSIETNNKNIGADFKSNEKHTDIIKIEVTETMHESNQTENNDKKITTKNFETDMVSTVLTTQITPSDEEPSTIYLPQPSKDLPTTETLQHNASLDQKVIESKVTETSVKNTIQDTETPELTTFKSQITDNMVSTVSTKHVTGAVKHEESTSILLPHPSKESPTAEALQQNANLNPKVIETKVPESSVKNTNQNGETSQSTTFKSQVMDNTVSTIANKQVTATVKHEESSNISLPHSSKESPTAEALQKNASLHEKVTEPTAIEPSSKPTVNTMQEVKTPETVTHKNNTATKLNNHILTLVSGILLHRCI